MIYMSQENKKQIAPQIKAVMQKYGMRGSLSVDYDSTLAVTLMLGKLDIIGNVIAKSRPDWARAEKRATTIGVINVNPDHLDNNYTGNVLNFFKELKAAMNGAGSAGLQNSDKSDIMSDSYNVGWHVAISVGKQGKPYIYTGK